mmetsp:Transcript_18377/g.73732  ORF Transcript_18377/g.73732 Transcript_18377/m.73732 type:complete len:347 (-) Transcript_18377:636-1676(-)
MDKVSTNVSESIKSISDKVSEIIAAEEAEIKEELLKTRKKASASSNSVVEEYLAKKQRTEDGLKRVRYSVQRILSSWQQRQIKRVEDISKGLVRTLGRARSRPRYVSRGELDNAVKELKESLSLDEIEDQVIRVIQDEIRKINAKISPRQRLTREEMGQEVFERVIADKGGRPDFALQSAGAYVVRTSPSYAYQLVTAFKERALTLLGRYKADFVMGFPNSPSMAITVSEKACRLDLEASSTAEHVHNPACFLFSAGHCSWKVLGISRPSEQHHDTPCQTSHCRRFHCGACSQVSRFQPGVCAAINSNLWVPRRSREVKRFHGSDRVLLRRNRVFNQRIGFPHAVF